MNWRGVALVMIWAGAGPAMAQSPIALTSHVETGWTSNATDSASGEGDFYASHTQELSLTGAADNFVLRGSLALSQTRFVSTTFEDDDEVAGAVEGELALGPGVVLRLGYAMTRSWTGDDLFVSGLVIPTRTVQSEHEYVAEVVVAGPDQQVTVGVNAGWVAPGDTTLVGFAVPPVRLSPEVGSVAVRVVWERALSPTVAALAGMEARFTAVPASDQITFLRAPANGGRVAAGLRMDDGMVMLEGSGGLDLVWPKGRADLMETSPYFALSASLEPVPEVTLAVGAETGVELASPLDGVAGQTVSIDIGAAWLARPDLTLSAKLAGWHEVGLFEPRLGRSSRTATLAANFAVSERFGYGVSLSWSRHDDPDEGYDKSGIAFSVSGAL